MSPADSAAIDVTGTRLAPLRFAGLETPRLGTQVGGHVPRSPDESTWTREWTYQLKRDLELRLGATSGLLLELAGYPLAEDPAAPGIYSLGGEIIYYDIETREGYARDSVTVGLGIRWDLISPEGDSVFAKDTWNERREVIFSDVRGSILNLTNRIFLIDMIELLRDRGFRGALGSMPGRDD